MKVKIKVEKEVELKTLHVEAKVRYWGDSEIDGENDTDNGDLIPCKEENIWKPVIELETGKIINWSQGVKADIHYKVCDAGCYYLKDEEGNTVLSIERDYVPSLLYPKENGYGDYIIMDINENGMIQNWKPDLSSFMDDDYEFSE